MLDINTLIVGILQFVFTNTTMLRMTTYKLFKPQHRKNQLQCKLTSFTIVFSSFNFVLIDEVNFIIMASGFIHLGQLKIHL